MRHKKLFLYISVAIIWSTIAISTIFQDHTNHALSYYWDDGESMEIELANGSSISYQSYESGDTQLILKYANKEVYASLPHEVSGVGNMSVFPAGNKHIGVSFHHESGLDTMVLFTEAESQIFQHVIAMDSGTGRLAYLETTAENELHLVVTTFENKLVERVKLENTDPSFLDNPVIKTAKFHQNEFWLSTEKESIIVKQTSIRQTS